MLYRLEHIQDHRTIFAMDFRQAQRTYYYQWRNDDGSIPWRIFYGDYEISPTTGNILKGA